MAVATDFQDLLSNLEITGYDFDPDGTSATDVAWVDMRDSSSILIKFQRTVGTSDLTFSVIANSESDGSGTDVTVKTKTLTGVQPNAVGDCSYIEVSQSEIAQAATDAGESGVRYVSASLAFGTGTDEGAVTYVRKPKHAKLDLTADSIA